MKIFDDHRSLIKTLYVNLQYNVRQVMDELYMRNILQLGDVSISTLKRFLVREGLWKRDTRVHPRDEKKRQALISHKDVIIHMYVDDLASIYNIQDDLRRRGNAFSASMIRSYLQEWGVLRSLSESNSIRHFANKSCDCCHQQFIPRSSQHQCCEICVPPTTQDRSRWNAFRMSRMMYDALLDKQQHRCALCNRDLNMLPSNQVHLDHCHITNRVRGVLCQKCNHCLSVIENHPGWGYRAEEYVKKGGA